MIVYIACNYENATRSESKRQDAHGIVDARTKYTRRGRLKIVDTNDLNKSKDAQRYKFSI